MLQMMNKCYMENKVKNSLYRNTHPNEYFPLNKFEFYMHRDDMEENICDEIINYRKKHHWGKMIVIKSIPENGNTSFLNYLIMNVYERSKIYFDKILNINGKIKHSLLRRLYPEIFNNYPFKSIYILFKFKLKWWQKVGIIVIYGLMILGLLLIKGWISSLLGVLIPPIVSEVILCIIRADIPRNIDAYFDTNKSSWLLDKLKDKQNIHKKIATMFTYGVYLFIDDFENLGGDDKNILISMWENAEKCKIRSCVILTTKSDRGIDEIQENESLYHNVLIHELREFYPSELRFLSEKIYQKTITTDEIKNLTVATLVRGVTKEEVKKITQFLKNNYGTGDTNKIDEPKLIYYIYFVPTIQQYFPIVEYAFLYNRLKDLYESLKEFQLISIDESVMWNDRSYFRDYINNFIRFTQSNTVPELIKIRYSHGLNPRYLINTRYMKTVKELNKKFFNLNSPGHIRNINFMWGLSYYLKQKKLRKELGQKTIEIFNNANLKYLDKYDKLKINFQQHMLAIGDFFLYNFCDYKLARKAFEVCNEVKPESGELAAYFGKIYLCTANRDITFDMVKHSDDKFYPLLHQATHNKCDDEECRSDTFFYNRQLISYQLIKSIIRPFECWRITFDTFDLLSYSLSEDPDFLEIWIHFQQIDINILLFQFYKEAKNLSKTAYLLDSMCIEYFFWKEKVKDRHSKLVLESYYKTKLIYFLYKILFCYEQLDHYSIDIYKTLKQNLIEILNLSPQAKDNWKTQDFYCHIYDILKDTERLLYLTLTDFLLVDILNIFADFLKTNCHNDVEKLSKVEKKLKKGLEIESENNISFYSCFLYWMLLLFKRKNEERIPILKELLMHLKKFKYPNDILIKTVLELLHNIEGLPYDTRDEILKYFQIYNEIIKNKDALKLEEKIEFLSNTLIYKIQNTENPPKQLEDLHKLKMDLEKLPCNPLQYHIQIEIDLVEYQVRKKMNDEGYKKIIKNACENLKLAFTSNQTIYTTYGIFNSIDNKYSAILDRKYDIIRYYLSNFPLDSTLIQVVQQHYFDNPPKVITSQFIKSALEVIRELTKRGDVLKSKELLMMILKKDIESLYRERQIIFELLDITTNENERVFFEGRLRDIETRLIPAIKNIENPVILFEEIKYTSYAFLDDEIVDKVTEKVYYEFHELYANNNFHDCVNILTRWLKHYFSLKNVSFEHIKLLEYLGHLYNQVDGYEEERKNIEIIIYKAKIKKILTEIDKLKIKKTQFKEIFNNIAQKVLQWETSFLD